jgi:hypothetical protein
MITIWVLPAVVRSVLYALHSTLTSHPLSLSPLLPSLMLCHNFRAPCPVLCALSFFLTSHISHLNTIPPFSLSPPPPSLLLCHNFRALCPVPCALCSELHAPCSHPFFVSLYKLSRQWAGTSSTSSSLSFILP